MDEEEEPESKPVKSKAKPKAKDADSAAASSKPSAKPAKANPPAAKKGGKAVQQKGSLASFFGPAKGRS